MTHAPQPDQDRFRRLFADLEAQAEAGAGAQEDARAEELSRDAAARVSLVDRLRATSSDLVLVVRGLGGVRGRVRDVGPDVVELAAADGAQWVVPLHALIWVDGLPPRGVEPATVGHADARLGLAALLRRWVRDRLPVAVHLVEGGTLTGTPDRAAADHLDIAEHDLDLPRRDGAVRRVVAVPYAAVAAIRRR